MSSTTIALLAAFVATITAQGVRDPATMLVNADDIKQAQRLIELTSTARNSITEDCKDLKNADLTKCKADLAQELADLQLNVTRKFLETFFDFALAVIPAPDRNGNFDANFDNQGECQRAIDTLKEVGVDEVIAANAAALLRNKCNNNAANLGNVAVEGQDLFRDAVRAEEKNAKGDVFAAEDGLAFFQLAVVDKKLNANQRAEFVSLVSSDERRSEIIDGLFLGSLGNTVKNLELGGYYTYQRAVVAPSVVDDNKELTELLKLAAPLIAKGKFQLSEVQNGVVKLVDTTFLAEADKFNLLNRNNAKNELVIGLDKSFKQAEKRPLVFGQGETATIVKVTGVVKGAEAAAIQKFADVMPAEVLALGAVADPADNNKVILTLIIVSEAARSTIINIDHEFALVCAQDAALTCSIEDDVSADFFAAAQIAPPITETYTKKTLKSDVPYHTDPHVVDTGASSSLFVAAGAVLAALAMFF